MSVESAKQFIQRMKSDTDFADAIIQCKGTDRRTKKIQEAGYTFSVEELRTAGGAKEGWGWVL